MQAPVCQHVYMYTATRATTTCTVLTHMTTPPPHTAIPTLRANPHAVSMHFQCWEDSLFNTLLLLQHWQSSVYLHHTRTPQVKESNAGQLKGNASKAVNSKQA